MACLVTYTEVTRARHLACLVTYTEVTRARHMACHVTYTEVTRAQHMANKLGDEIPHLSDQCVKIMEF